ncbi:hypothetical protein HN51_059978 [Arachis hypogaea]|uniref:Retrotransposon gag domain-containing protein n=1 Tax=Arachis hypogaea TaxID=3818 RepID=A0A444X7Z0_ARAHY|nr:uncharacterized protein LOC107621616 [Arachis ipaensis]XP_025683921.1 uncharacterized protein LOC112784808 [Arachis hypogaea]RYQ85815.1 hypothetical protein Ahy_B10g105433 [Arachis hypogaea]
MAIPKKNSILEQMLLPDLNHQPFAIHYPKLDVDFELKDGFIRLLPKFHGRDNEDPHKHLKEFHMLCCTMVLRGVNEDQIKLRAFPLSLEGVAKDWLLYLPDGVVQSWVDLKKLFLLKFFPASRAIAITKALIHIKQSQGEDLYNYFERFNRLIASYPNLPMSEHALIEQFYEGLLDEERMGIDVASGGALRKKTPEEAREVIATMAENRHHFGNLSLG